MGSIYLELTNAVLRRLNEVELTDTDFAGARGIHATAKDAVRHTLRKIYTQKFEWPFNKEAGSQILDVGTVEYAWPEDLKIPDWESFYIENDGTLSTSTVALEQISKERYWKYCRPTDLDSSPDGIRRPEYVFEASGVDTSGDPVTTRGGFGVTPSPDQEYVVRYTYFVNPSELSLYDDESRIPSAYDYIVIDGALHYMYTFLDNAERAALLESAFNKGLDHMTYILIPKSPTMTAGRANPGGLNFSTARYYGE